MPSFFNVRCERCSWSALWTDKQLAAAMRGVGMLKRADTSDLDLFRQLVQAAAPRILCPDCNQAGLTMIPAEDPDADAWGDARVCQGCGQVIPPERLQVFPQATLCATCQRSDEAGANQEVDYCPRCGTPRRVVSRSSGGVSRYVAVCPQCGGS